MARHFIPSEIYRTNVTPPITAEGSGSHDIHGKKMFHAVKLDETCFSLNPDLSST